MRRGLVWQGGRDDPFGKNPLGQAHRLLLDAVSLRAPAAFRRPETHELRSAAMKAKRTAIEVTGMGVAVIPPVAVAPKARAHVAEPNIGSWSVRVVGWRGRRDDRHRQADSHIDAGSLGAWRIKAPPRPAQTLTPTRPAP